MTVSELLVGTKVKDARNGNTFLVGAHGHENWPGTVMVSEKVLSRRSLDLPKEEYGDAERRKFGSNDYPASDLHRWLNSDAEDGFLAELSPELRGALLKADVPYSREAGKVEYFDALVFLPSVEELGLSFVEHTKEGSRIELFKEFRRRFALPTAMVVDEALPGWGALNENDSWCYWLRSSHAKHSSVQYVCHSHSPYVFYAANRDYVGVRPLFCVQNTLEVEKHEGEYVVISKEGGL